MDMYFTGLRWNIAMKLKDGGEFLTLGLAPTIRQVEESWHGAPNLVSTRPAASKWVLELLQKEKKNVIGRSNATSSSKADVGRREKPKLFQRNQNHRDSRRKGRENVLE